MSAPNGHHMYRGMCIGCVRRFGGYQYECLIADILGALADAEARLAAVIALCEPHVRLDANTDAALLHWAIDKIRAAATGDQQ